METWFITNASIVLNWVLYINRNTPEMAARRTNRSLRTQSIESPVTCLSTSMCLTERQYLSSYLAFKWFHYLTHSSSLTTSYYKKLTSVRENGTTASIPSFYSMILLVIDMAQGYRGNSSTPRQKTCLILFFSWNLLDILDLFSIE